MYNSLAAVIPVRLSSSRIDQKVLLPIGDDNISLLEWKIKQLQEILGNEQIFVSTESDQLKDIAQKRGVQIHHRDHYLSDGHKATFSEVITGIVKDIPFEHIAWVTAVVPLMKPTEYKDAFQQYFEQTVNLFPDKLAICDNTSLLSFNELRHKAKFIATEISRKYKSINCPVAIYLPKTNDSIISFIATLYSGNCYAPLDTKNPINRIESILKVLSPLCIVTNNMHIEKLKKFKIFKKLKKIEKLKKIKKLE